LRPIGAHDQLTRESRDHPLLPTTMIKRHTVDADGHPLALWEKSPSPSRGSILLLHGRTWSTLPNFDLQVPGENLSLMDGLVDAGYAAFAVDFRGYGQTPRDDTGWVTPDRTAKDLKAALEHIRLLKGGAAPPTLLGWSRGSKVAQLTVQRWPELVSSLVFFGYSPTFAGAPLADDEEDALPARAPNTAENAASDFITPGSISKSAIATYVKSALEADPVRADWGRAGEWDELDPVKIRVPTLLLHAEFDPIATPEQRRSLFDSLGTRDRASVEIQGGDHMAFIESCRSDFLSALVDFLDRHRAS
jgi:pimeloyl-ACP methyl ester carboxylesterase